MLVLRETLIQAMLEKIFPIPAFADNYIWAFTDEPGRNACVVDPGDAEPVIAHLESRKLNLSHILITHHHADHTGGVNRLAERYRPTVFGPAKSPFKSVTRRLNEGDAVTVFGLEFGVFEVPGHTLDHIAYYGGPGQGIREPVLFCGDTLFSAGCGRLFEGSPEMMFESLQKLAALPLNTRVYCTHEYTLANLRFASTADPGNADLQRRKAEVERIRREDRPTLPSSIDLELAVNPFLRCADAGLIESVSRQTGETLSDPVAVFAGLRHWKDHFQG